MKIKLRDETFRFVQSNTLNPFTVIFFVCAGIMGYLVGVVYPTTLFAKGFYLIAILFILFGTVLLLTSQYFLMIWTVIEIHKNSDGTIELSKTWKLFAIIPIRQRAENLGRLINVEHGSQMQSRIGEVFSVTLKCSDKCLDIDLSKHKKRAEYLCKQLRIFLLGYSPESVPAR